MCGGKGGGEGVSFDNICTVPAVLQSAGGFFIQTIEGTHAGGSEIY